LRMMKVVPSCGKALILLLIPCYPLRELLLVKNWFLPAGYLILATASILMIYTCFLCFMIRMKPSLSIGQIHLGVSGTKVEFHSTAPLLGL
jgi:hypothetical protein